MMMDQPVDVSVGQFQFHARGKRVFLVSDPEIAADLRRDSAAHKQHLRASVDHMLKKYERRMAGGDAAGQEPLVEPAEPVFIDVPKLIGMAPLPFMVPSVESTSMYEEMDHVEHFCFAGSTFIAVPTDHRVGTQAWYSVQEDMTPSEKKLVEETLQKRFDVAARIRAWSKPEWMTEINPVTYLKAFDSPPSP